MTCIAEDSSGMVYSDYWAIRNGVKSNHPVIDYQEGSLRDDFNFGSPLLYRTAALKEAAEEWPRAATAMQVLRPPVEGVAAASAGISMSTSTARSKRTGLKQKISIT